MIKSDPRLGMANPFHPPSFRFRLTESARLYLAGITSMAGREWKSRGSH